MQDERRENDSVILEWLKELNKKQDTILERVGNVELKVAQIQIPTRPCNDFLLHENKHHETPCEELKKHLEEAKEEAKENKKTKNGVLTSVYSWLAIGLLTLLFNGIIETYKTKAVLPDKTEVKKEHLK